MKKHLRNLATAVILVAAVAAVGPVRAQVPSVVGPYNVDLGALIKNAAQGPATVNSAQQQNLDQSGVVCSWNQASHTGSPTSSFSIQNYDAASGSYYQVAQIGSLTADNPVTAPTVLAVEPALPASAPAGFSVTINAPLARYWRVQEIITGTATVTGTVGCVLVK